MSDSLVIAIITGLCSAGVMSFIQFLINRKDQRSGTLTQITNRLTQLEKATTRLQMMVLMKSFPEDEAELMKVSEHYFVEQKGDWYMTTLFRNHMSERKIPAPPWFT